MFEECLYKNIEAHCSHQDEAFIYCQCKLLYMCIMKLNVQIAVCMLAVCYTESFSTNIKQTATLSTQSASLVMSD